jgi:hypothetical protein
VSGRERSAPPGLSQNRGSILGRYGKQPASGVIRRIEVGVTVAIRHQGTGRRRDGPNTGRRCSDPTCESGWQRRWRLTVVDGFQLAGILGGCEPWRHGFAGRDSGRQRRVGPAIEGVPPCRSGGTTSRRYRWRRPSGHRPGGHRRRRLLGDADRPFRNPFVLWVFPFTVTPRSSQAARSCLHCVLLCWSRWWLDGGGCGDGSCVSRRAARWSHTRVIRGRVGWLSLRVALRRR